MSLLLPVQCGCQHRLPLRVQPQGLALLRQVIQASTVAMDPDAVLETYWCGKCRQVVPLTLRDLALLTS